MENHIFYALAAIDEITETPDQFLTKRETAKADSFRFPKRKSEWIAGRRTLKRLIRSVCADEITDDRQIEIIPDANGKPQFAINGKLREETVSISHRENVCAAAIQTDGISFGLDLEKIEAKPLSFEQDYFTLAERSAINSDPALKNLRLASFWSAKESVLKSLGIGLRLDLRRIEISESIPQSGSDHYGYAQIIEPKNKRSDFNLYRILLPDHILLTVAAESGTPVKLRKIEV